MIDAATSTAWYVYAFVGPCSPGVRAALGGSPGVGAGELTVAGDHSLAAVVGRVSLAEFGEDVLPERLNDRAWLEQKVRAHELVLDRLVEVTTVIPLRFGSIYRDLAAVDELVDRRRDELVALLGRLRGRVELGVHAWIDRRGSAAAEEPQAASGRAYLERRRDERVRADEASLRLQELLGDAHERLSAHADDGVVNRPQPRELTGREEEMVFNAAYLVPSDDRSLAAEVAELNDRERARGLVFELTGPWPPHNFVDLEDDE